MATPSPLQSEPKRDQAWLQAEAERLGLTVEQLVDVVVGGALDALEQMLAERRAEKDGEAA